jgi:hypothetical protein
MARARCLRVSKRTCDRAVDVVVDRLGTPTIHPAFVQALRNGERAVAAIAISA